MAGSGLNELLEFQINRNVVNMYKNYLTLLEDLQAEHENAFNKLKRAIPEGNQLIAQADYLDQAKMDYLRKKVLDSGNHCFREIKTELEKFNVTINI